MVVVYTVFLRPSRTVRCIFGSQNPGQKPGQKSGQKLVVVVVEELYTVFLRPSRTVHCIFLGAKNPGQKPSRNPDQKPGPEPGQKSGQKPGQKSGKIRFSMYIPSSLYMPSGP